MKSAFLLSSLRFGTVRIGRSRFIVFREGVEFEAAVAGVGVRGALKATILC